MRKSLLFLLAFFISAIASAQTTIPVTGNVSQILGSPQPYASVTIQLQNCPAPVSVTGSSVIVNAQADIQADASGFVNSTVIPNNLINCNGTTGNSQYAVQYIVGGVPSANPVCFQVTSTQGIWNLNTQQPIVCGQTPPAPGDETLNNLVIVGFLQANGAQFAGSVSILGNLTLAHFPGTCGAGLFISGLDTNLTKTCSGPPVASVFGRTGAVVAQSGDYNYGQIAGTPLTAATLISNPYLVNAAAVGINGQPLCWKSDGGAGACPKATLTLPVTSIPANTCTTPQTAALVGVRATSTFSTSFSVLPTAANGWGAIGGLVVQLAPDASNDLFDWNVCNQTTSAITPGASSLNVGVL